MFIYWGCQVRPVVTNPNTTTFMCPDLFEPLRFMNNSTALGNNFDNSEERFARRFIEDSKKFSTKFLIQF